jgi:hypothetical protein
MALSSFFNFVSDFKGVASLLAKAALIAPFASLLLNIGPPWPTRTAVPALTSLCELLVLMYAFQFYTPLAKKRISTRLRAYFLQLILSFAAYISLYSFFVFKAYGDRDVKGFIVQPAIKAKLEPGLTLEALLEGAEWDPLRIWEAWTVYSMRISLLLMWILFFVSIAGCIATFVVLQRTGTSGGRRTRQVTASHDRA